VHGDLASSNVLLTRTGARGACGVLGVGRLRAKARPLQSAGPCTQCFAVPRLLGWTRVCVSGDAARSLCTPCPSHRFPGARSTRSMEGQHVVLLSLQALCLDAPCGVPGRAESALRGGSGRRSPCIQAPRVSARCLPAAHSVSEAPRCLPGDALAAAHPQGQGRTSPVALTRARRPPLLAGGGLWVHAAGGACQRHRRDSARRARLPGAGGAGAARAQPCRRLLRVRSAAVGDADSAGAPWLPRVSCAIVSKCCWRQAINPMACRCRGLPVPESAGSQ
jgi:hypothetical protein